MPGLSTNSPEIERFIADITHWIAYSLQVILLMPPTQVKLQVKPNFQAPIGSRTTLSSPNFMGKQLADLLRSLLANALDFTKLLCRRGEDLLS